MQAFQQQTVAQPFVSLGNPFVASSLIVSQCMIKVMQVFQQQTVAQAQKGVAATVVSSNRRSLIVVSTTTTVELKVGPLSFRVSRRKRKDRTSALLSVFSMTANEVQRQANFASYLARTLPMTNAHRQ